MQRIPLTAEVAWLSDCFNQGLLRQGGKMLKVYLLSGHEKYILKHNTKVLIPYLPQFSRLLRTERSDTMGPEISSSTQTPPARLTTTNLSKTNPMQKVRQAQAEQQKAAQNTAAAQASAQESQNNLRAAQSEERRAAERVSSAQAEHRKNSQPQQAEATGKIIDVQA